MSFLPPVLTVPIPFGETSLFSIAALLVYFFLGRSGESAMMFEIWSLKVIKFDEKTESTLSLQLTVRSLALALALREFGFLSASISMLEAVFDMFVKEILKAAP